ncbi:MAG TPA: hypothetical protein VM261_23385 [Kofleriaceae bacterium]|nr:hypothetical protein [Kofleriaceae bacterium]
MKAVLAGFVLSLCVAACAAFDGDPPDRSCRGDNDCFRAQGERCNVDTRQCVCMEPVLGCVQADAGVAPVLVDDPSFAPEVSQ